MKIKAKGIVEDAKASIGQDISPIDLTNYWAICTEGYRIFWVSEATPFLSCIKDAWYCSKSYKLWLVEW